MYLLTRLGFFYKNALYKFTVIVLIAVKMFVLYCSDAVVKWFRKYLFVEVYHFLY